MKYDRTGKQPGWRARTTSQAGSSVVAEYFKIYPLFNSKQLDFEAWKKCHDLISNKVHLIKNGDEGVNTIRTLKSTMNTNRKFIT